MTPEAHTSSATESVIPPEHQPYMEDAEQFISRFKEVFYAVANDRSVQFTIGTDFFIDLEKRVVTLDVKDFLLARTKGLSEWQIVWSVCHEISHLYDLKESPKEMLENFTYLEKRARELVPRAHDVIQQTHGTVPDYLTREISVYSKKTKIMSALQYFLYTKLHMLYNSLDDMYVNETIGLRTAAFAKDGSKQEEITRLYRDYLFPTHPSELGAQPKEGEAFDMASLPRSYQFAYWLLRKRMVPEQPLFVSPDVEAALNSYTDSAAQAHGIARHEQIDLLTHPRGPKAKNRNPGWRYDEIRALAEPVFIDLLMKDLADTEFPPPPDSKDKEERDKQKQNAQKKKQDSTAQEQEADNELGKAEEQEREADANGDKEEKKDAQKKKQAAQKKKQNAQNAKAEADKEFNDASSPWDEQGGNPEPIDLDVISDFLKQQDEIAKKQKKKEKEEKDSNRLTPEKRAQEAEKMHDKVICKKHKVNPLFAAEYRVFERSISAYKEDLAAVFSEIMKTIAESVKKHWIGGFRSGRFDVNSFIKKYAPELAAGQYHAIPFEQLDTYSQREFERRLIFFPNRIRVRLALDGSQSMEKDRLHALKQLVVLFIEGLATFEAELNLRFRFQRPIMIDTEVCMFGSPGKSKVIKKFAAEKGTPEEEIADRFRSLEGISNFYGDTCDAEPLWKIAQTINEELSNALKSGRAKEFVFEITDGGTNKKSAFAKKNDSPAQDSRNAIHALEQAGVIARGFQIGVPSQEEVNIFDSIWGTDGAHIPHPSDLAHIVAGMLSEELKKTEIQLSFAGEDGTEERISLSL